MVSIKLLHLLLFVYWLGADLGTFYASRFVADHRLAPAARATAAKIMLGIDITPRICMPLVLGSGVHLAASLGLLPAAAIALGWGLALGWLGLVLWIHHRGASAAAWVRFDFGFRIAVIAGLMAAALSLPALPLWLLVKLCGFGITIACGLMIRVHLKPFGPAFAQAMAGGANAEAAHRIVAASIARCVPYVIAIWVVLVVCAAAGRHFIF